MRIRIRNVHVIDPGNIDGIMNILIEDGKISKIDPASPETWDSDAGRLNDEKAPMQVIDGTGKVLVPGLIDMHVHFRDPGYEYKETIETGCLSAAAGGFTGVCTMPNTRPITDNSQTVRYILKKAEAACGVKVYPVAAVSMESKGKALCEYGDLKKAGAVALSDDGMPVSNTELLRRAMEYAAIFGLFIISHCEDAQLAAGGVMNEGPVATRLGLRGMPNAAESIHVMRDIAVCELTKTPLHIAHVSTRESIRAIRDAKKRGIPVTAETAPHYFSLTDEAVESYNTNAKMNPPLRSGKDREAVREGLADGTIDAIATDHAPQSAIEKDVEFDRAANGIIGLETSLPLSLKLVEQAVLTLPKLIEKMSVNPGRIIGHPNRIAIGASADLTMIDLEKEFTVEAERFLSLSRNSPFNGWRMKGKAVLTMVEGQVVFKDF
ncbi:MAG: dihydroorotase [Desulfobacteraceae bacterium]|nr:MAG: dihydroorotase [Desulfobacteraceae bacterium]